jgi:hypothetical protein
MASLPITVEQRITASNQFDGAAPTTVAVDDPDTGVRVYSTDTVGGRFDSLLSSHWLSEVQRIAGDFGNAATVDIAIVNGAGDEVLIYSATAGGTVLITDLFRLAPDEFIRIVTTGATGAMVARVTVRPAVSRPA